jgi:N-acylneuraminate cytidylyltransferase
MKIIAIITARGGSKRIPRKNIKEFFGKPMIKYAIDAALESKLFDTVMVSTDDDEIAVVAAQCGAEIPFMRSEETADDIATTSDVLLEVIDGYKKLQTAFDNLCCIYPCVPFLTSETLINAYNLFKENDVDMLMPIVQFSYPIQRSLKINRQGFLEYAQPEYIRARSQDLESMYHDVGMFYFYKTEALLKKEKIIKPFKMKESEIQDIDTLEDWKMAEIKYKMLRKCSLD